MFPEVIVSHNLAWTVRSQFRRSLILLIVSACVLHLLLRPLQIKHK